jgi:Ser/Thr protein kinase RdoA (MazF antagonist)
METTFPVTNSTLSVVDLAMDVVPAFGVGSVAECKFFSFGINDTYRVRTRADEIYFMRVYRAGLRSRSDVSYELEMLNHLHKKGVGVAHPLPTRSGSYFLDLPAPEGTRFAALFTLAPGKEPSYDEQPQILAEKYGRAVAKIHNALDDFPGPSRRAGPDLDHLIDTPLKHIEPFLAEQPEMWEYIRQFSARLRKRILECPADTLELGACHGDLQGYHAHIAENGSMTFYDFDFCGFGFRSYDLAVFRWCARLKDQEDIWWEPYLQGYCDERSIADVDLRAVPLFICARHIWHMGLHTANAHTWGCGDLNESYFSGRIKWLHDLERDYLS